MRLSSVVPVLAAFLLAAALCLVAARFAAMAVEESSEIGVRRALDENDLLWVEVGVDGLQVILSGVAPTEAQRFNAVSVVGGQVDAARILDQMEVEATAAIAPPRFSAEILRNDSGISIIGLIPRVTDREGLIADLRRRTGEDRVADLLESADYPVPSGWEDALGFAVTVLSRLPRSKISVDAGQIEITAISESAEEKRELETELERAVPPGLNMILKIAAPRPVITPFTLRFLIEDSQGRFDACSADTEDTANRILTAAREAARLTGPETCTVGMGVPSPHWGTAAEMGISALARLGQGTVTYADADVTLVAATGTDQALFDRIVGELEADLPEVFALHAILPQPEVGGDELPAEFVATLSPEGLVQLRGRLNDETLRNMADSFAKSAFGSENVYTAARVVENMPESWPTRVLVGLEALAYLNNGSVTVSPDQVLVRGVTQREDARAAVAGLLSGKLGDGVLYSLDITYRAPPPPEKIKPTPEECQEQLQAVQTGAKIAFEPGSATIAEESLGVMNRIADILKDCGEILLEIQGHTDSQGRESMNLELSQARANSVLNELIARRVLTASYEARGYGETQPIADNKTEAGREANRRIEFHLILPEQSAEQETTLEQAASADQDTDAQPENNAGEEDSAAAEENTDEQN